MTSGNSHLIVVGSGIAGLYGSLLAAEAGFRVTLLTKGELAQSNTHYAQGGICAVLDSSNAAPGDSVEAHIADTLKAGAGQCDPGAVRILCSEAYGDISALERFSVVFDRDPVTGKRLLGLEGAHSAARILHAGGDATGAAIADGLIRSVRDAAALGTIKIVEHAFVKELRVHGGRVTGVELLMESGKFGRIDADAVLLATGGAGQLFEHTTNPFVATADGLAAAWRAGAVVTDLEYFQFHPTALAVSGNFLISEAVRGAGAVLRDAAGDAFMKRYHPEGDLAPRDVVSRSIVAHLHNTGAAPAGTVYLDATGVETTHGTGYLARRFPTIDAKTRELGFDWTKEWLPVAPAAHYWMGGVATDLQGRTTLPGLYAAGEVACTGVHGANRLASNSLLEGLVFGRRAVETLVDTDLAAALSAGSIPVQPQLVHIEAATAVPENAETLPFTRQALQQLMGEHAAVVRDAAGLDIAAQQLAAWRSQAPAEFETTELKTQLLSPQAAAELENMLTVSALLVAAALARQESIGAHFRSDFPAARTETDGADASTDVASAGQTAPGEATTAESTAEIIAPSGRSSNYWVGSRPDHHRQSQEHSPEQSHPQSLTHLPTNFPVLESETT